MLRYASQSVVVTFMAVLIAFRSSAAATDDDLIIAYNGNNVSTKAILRRLNITGNFRFGAFCPRDEHSCQARCLNGAVGDVTERQMNLPCYCDSHCLDVGDCCYDFFSSCSQVQKSRHSQHTQWQCVNMTSSSSYGYVMKTKCPQGTVEPEIQTLCETVDNSDFLRGMPVVDEQAGVVYRNVFCARCNSVQSVSYWRMTADCGRIPASALPQDNALLLAFIRENCTVNYKPTDAQKKYLKKCLVAENSCSSKKIVDKEPVLQELCSYYAFPICGATTPKNPHCALCNGNDIIQLNCGCLAAGTSDPSTHVTSIGSTTARHTSTPQSTSPPHTTKPGTTHLPHTTNPGTTHPPHTTNPGTTHPLHTTDPGTTYLPHTTNLGTTHPLHTTNPGTTHPPHTNNPGTTHPPPTTNPGTTHPLNTTNPGTRHPPHTTNPVTTHQLYTTNPGTTQPLHTTNPGTTHPPHTTNPGTTHQLYTTNPGATHQLYTTNPGTTQPPHTTNPRTTHLPHTTNPGTTHLPHTTNRGPTHPPHTTNPGLTTPPHQPPTKPGTTHPPQFWTTPPAYYTTRPGHTMPPMTVPKTPGFELTTIKSTTRWPPHSEQPPPPPLSILFDFSSNEISIQGKTIETKVVEQKTCQDGFVYDPFVKKCRKAFLKVIVNTNSTINSTNSTSDVVTMLNCSSVQLNTSDIVLYPNGTLWVPLYATEYNSTDYFMNGSYVFLCTNFASNYSKRETITKWFYVVSPLQILTYAGCSVSVLSLLILLVVYCIFKELRTLPGKNLINLSFAMIFYHTFLFVAGFRNMQALCTGIAILLHYSLLCSFAWMSIMAFDVAKTFVFHDNDVRSQQQNGNRRKTLYKYCVCAWGLPGIAVLTCFTLDYTQTVTIGYGRGGFCWIKNGTALLAVVGVPVALVILFNFIALTWTVVSIYKVRKVTNKLTDQRNHSSLALLYIKLTCVLGLTWVFGFLNSIVKTDSTAYLFVVVNSLQGFFICLTFIAKKRTVALLRGPRKKQHERGDSKNTLETKL